MSFFHTMHYLYVMRCGYERFSGIPSDKLNTLILMHIKILEDRFFKCMIYMHIYTHIHV